jgi:very-short-patch-repair endonuclease
MVKGSQNFGASNNIKAKARDLRHRMTKQELILWQKLRKKQQNGMRFRRQHPCGIYILDFFCFEENLVIEVDGLIHLKHKEYDDDRTRFLESAGLKLLRFTNEEIDTRLEWVLEVIKNPHVSLSPLGETGKGVKEKEN